MRSIAAFLLSFVASTMAYQVLSPNGQSGWTNQGSQNVSWARVDTDPLNFTIVLINQNLTGFEPQILAALVDGTLGFTRVNSHNLGWPTGDSFRVNFVKDDVDLNTILAQSSFFSIEPANTTTTGSTGTTNTPTATSAPTITQSDNSGASTTNTPITIPTSGAVASYPVQTGLLVLFSLLGFTLA